VTLITSTDRTVQVSVQTRSMLGPEDAFRLIVPIDLSLVFGGWGSFPGVRGVRNQTGPGTPCRHMTRIHHLAREVDWRVPRAGHTRHRLTAL
jgi:hypothetical protein